MRASYTLVNYVSPLISACFSMIPCILYQPADDDVSSHQDDTLPSISITTTTAAAVVATAGDPTTTSSMIAMDEDVPPLVS